MGRGAHGATALFRAAGTGIVASARVLVNSGRFDLTASNGRGQSLVEVAQRSSAEMVRFLRGVGAGRQSTWWRGARG
ncbi:MAG: ankyrin repeat domain-containing protein [bacterium]|nr:ankyrin repeat domain-containing protein [bacterium]